MDDLGFPRCGLYQLVFSLSPGPWPNGFVFGERCKQDQTDDKRHKIKEMLFLQTASPALTPCSLFYPKCENATHISIRTIIWDQYILYGKLPPLLLENSKLCAIGVFWSITNEELGEHKGQISGNVWMQRRKWQ